MLDEKPFSGKADIWALGCCVYYLCTKNDPFGNEEKDLDRVKENIRKRESIVSERDSVDPIFIRLL